MFSFFKSLTGGKVISAEMLEPALEKMKEHLITKNVAAEISEKLCSSVMAKLEGKVIGTFSGEIQPLEREREHELYNYIMGGVQFTQIGDLYHFTCLKNMNTHAHDYL